MPQNIDSKGGRLLPTRQFFLDRLWVWITGIALWVIGTTALAILTPLGTTMAAIWEAPATLATISAEVAELRADVPPGTLAAISAEVAELRADVAQATGDDRVIRQPKGLSYVTEPVHLGEDVVFNLVIERTTLGANCDFIGGESLFTEAGGVMTPGSAIPASTRRLEAQQTRLHLRLTPPENLRPGRIELYLALEYDCDGKRVYDRTDTAVYSLLGKG